MADQVNAGAIKQTERLFTVRPRSVAYDQKAGGGGNRGTRAKFKLLTTNPSQTISRFKTDTKNSFGSASEADKVISTLINTGFNEFLLTSVSVALNEKVQVIQTFGDAEVVYYFGKAPIYINLTGTLIDSIDNQWFNSMLNAYTHAMRGSELARNYELIQLTLPNADVVGSVVSFTWNQDSQRDTDINFNMQVLAKEMRPIPVRVPDNIFNNNAELINFTKAFNMTNYRTLTEINSLKSTFSRVSSAVQDPMASSSTVTNILNSPQVGGILDQTSVAREAASPIPGLSGPVQESIKAHELPMSVGFSSSVANNQNPWGYGITEDGQGNPDLTGDLFGGRSQASLSTDPITGLTGGPATGGNIGSRLTPGQADFRPGFLTAGPAYQGAGNVSVAGFGSSLFSPVFGVLTSITKVVKSSTGDISKIISSFTNPVNTVLRDINSISAQAISVVKLIENSVQQIVNIPGRTLANITTTINSLKNAAGVISRAPETIAQTVKRLFKIGSLSSGALFLSKGGTAPGSKGALLRSGKPYTPASGAKFR